MPSDYQIHAAARMADYDEMASSADLLRQVALLKSAPAKTSGPFSGSSSSITQTTPARGSAR